MSKHFIRAAKATQHLEEHELLALRFLIDGQLSELVYEEPVEKKLERSLGSEKDYDADDQDPTVPVPTKKELDIQLLGYRLNDPRLTTEEKKQIRNEIVDLVLKDE